jgi:hypothetical protein
VRPEVSDAKLGLPGKDISWQTRRTNMVDVCLSCHNQDYVNAFYTQYDGLIDLYHEKFAQPGLALYQAAAPLLKPAKFSNPIDFTWFEIWHHEGRRARHGASMMGPDYTHWHGTYEVAKHFYTKFVPEIEELIEQNRDSSDPAKKEAAAKLAKLLEEMLNSPNHAWYLNKISPEEKALREKNRREFLKRYSKGADTSSVAPEKGPRLPEGERACPGEAIFPVESGPAPGTFGLSRALPPFIFPSSISSQRL